MNRSESNSMFERAKKIFPGGVHSPVRAFKGMDSTPLFFVEGEGAYLRSVDGERYIDFCQSFGPLILGHRDKDVVQAVEKTMQMIWTVGACEPYSLELGEKIRTWIPWLEQLRFVCSGTEAVMSALRVARGATGRPKILKFTGCYNGHSDGLLVEAGSGLAGESASSSAGISEDLVAHTLVAPLDDEAAVEKIFAKHGDEIAAMIIEPLPANYGLLFQRQEFLQSVVQTARKHGTLVVFDEVISGFRVAPGGMAEKLDIVPDLVTYGKVIGGGFPVGCFGGRKDLMQLVAPVGPVYQAGTLSANPIGMAAGLATLTKMEESGGYKELRQRTDWFVQELNLCLKRSDAPAEAIGADSLFWLKERGVTVRNPSQVRTEHVQWFNKFFEACLAKGVYLAPNAYEVGFLSLAHNKEVLSEALVVMESAAKEANE